MSAPLVLAAHGTDDPAGRAVVEEVAARAGALLGVPAHVGYVDVCGPELADVLAEVASDPAPQDGGPRAVVVPFFLASGYHVRYDVPSAVAALTGGELPDAGGGGSAVVVTPALGVEPEVVQALADRVRRAAPEAQAVVVTGAGSSVEAARAEVADVAAQVGAVLGLPVGTAFLSGPGPRPEEEIARLGVDGPGVVATHLLAPGHFHGRAQAAADAAGWTATEPLGTHAQVVDLVVRRYLQPQQAGSGAAVYS